MVNNLSLPSALLEFVSLQMRQIIENCHKLFTTEDVSLKVETWPIITFRFGDIEDDDNSPMPDNSLDNEVLGAMEWDEIINDV